METTEASSEQSTTAPHTATPEELSPDPPINNKINRKIYKIDQKTDVIYFE
jgi:hypothetical protein